MKRKENWKNSRIYNSICKIGWLQSQSKHKSEKASSHVKKEQGATTVYF